MYTTVQGDMWDFIAWKVMGSSDYTNLLMEANQAHLHTVTFPAGVSLTIPEIPASVNTALPPWKQ